MLVMLVVTNPGRVHTMTKGEGKGGSYRPEKVVGT